MTYTVDVTREGNAWIADVVDLPGAHTFAGNLETLAANVQEVIGLVLDRPESERFDVRFRYLGVDEEFRRAAELGERRAELEVEMGRLAEDTQRSASQLAAAEWSVRDIAGALHLSPGRVSQLLNAPR